MTMLFLCNFTGQKLDGIDSEAAAQKLRGRVGTSVTVKLKSVCTYYLHVSFVRNFEVKLGKFIVLSCR